MIEISIHTKPGTKILVNKFEITSEIEGPWAVLELQGEEGQAGRLFLSDLPLVEELVRALEEVRVHLGGTPTPALAPVGRFSEVFPPQETLVEDEDKEGRARVYWGETFPTTQEEIEIREEILGEDTRQSLRDLSGAEEWYV